MVYQLQDLRNDSEGFTRLGKLAKKSKDLFADKLILDMSQVNFLEANMASPLGAILTRISDNFNRIKIRKLNKDVKEILQKNRFLVQYGHEAIPDIYRTTMRFSRLHLADTGEFREYIFQQFDSNRFPGISDAATRVFYKKVFEIFQNSILHSRSETGVFVCGQYFPTQDRLEFTITDMGIGVRGSVRRYFKNKRIGSISALKWALKPRTTTRSSSGPGGLGLAELQEFARLNKGKIQIASRFAFYEFYPHGRERFLRLEADFPGTAVTIRVNTAD